MPTIKITTRQPKKEVLAKLHKLPEILQGKSDNPLFRRFTALLLHEIYRLISLDNKARSLGKAGTFTPRWKPLSPKTIKTKIYLKKKYPKLDPEHILIRSHRLLTSFLPGTLTETNYKPINPDQHISINYKQIILECKVPYYNEVTRIRPILPEKLNALIKQAITNIIPKLLPYIL